VELRLQGLERPGKAAAPLTAAADDLTGRVDYSGRMSRYAAFLRGINLGRNRRISSSELRSRFEEMGFRDVGTFRTSGNVIFDAGREPLAKMAVRIEQGLAESLGYEVVIFLRTASEIRAIADHQPFARTLVEASKGKLQVAILSTKPATPARKEMLALATDEDRLAFGVRELYWLPSGGTRDSALDFKTIGKLLGSTTMRTKGTIDQMAAKYFAE
jgi:uncharacterized protein (DUF1697 family)